MQQPHAALLCSVSCAASRSSLLLAYQLLLLAYAANCIIIAQFPVENGSQQGQFAPENNSGYCAIRSSMLLLAYAAACIPAAADGDAFVRSRCIMMLYNTIM
eukprot:COSAG06_NODE_7958_length_2322_cov_105.541610_2_plen_102_part_00